MKTKTRTVALKDIKVNLFVRKALDQNHVLYLAELIENDVKMSSPIKVNSDLELIDGRHRKEAYELNDVVEVEVEVVDIPDQTELIAEAYKANVGGALPPSQQDTEHTVMLLLERDVPMKHIGEMLRLPAGMARRYINEVKSKLARAKVLRAVSAVTEGGLTVAKAAEQHTVDVDKLKEALSGSRTRHKRGVTEMQRQLTKTAKSVAQRNAALLKSLLEKFEDGDVSEKQVLTIFAHIENLQKQSARSVADWKKRFHAMTGKAPAKRGELAHA